MDKKHGQFVTKSQIPGPLPLPTHQATLWLHPHFPWAWLLLQPKSSPSNSEIWYFFQGLVPKYHTKKAEIETQGSSSPERDVMMQLQNTGNRGLALGREGGWGPPFELLCLCHSAYGILVPQPWIKLLMPALEAQSPNHRTTQGNP